MSKLQDLSNAREEMQRRIMEELAESGECYLCPHVIARVAAKYPDVASSPIKTGEGWFVKHNDFPYEGTKLHVLIVPKRHITRLEDFSSGDFEEIQKMLKWVNATFGVRGASLFLRYGEMSFTGATLAHLHFHVLHGAEKHPDSVAIRAKLGYR